MSMQISKSVYSVSSLRRYTDNGLILHLWVPLRKGLRERIRGSQNSIFYTWQIITRTRLGRATPLGRPRSVYKSDVECCSLSQNGLEGQGQWPPFWITAERIPKCIFRANLVILALIYYQLLRTQARFPRIRSTTGQNDLEDDQWSPSSIAAERITGCMFAANLVILAQTCEESSREQVKFPIILSQNDLEGQGQWPPFFNIPWCMFGENLVIPVQICDELSCGQSKVYGQTDGGTDAGNDNTPSGWKAKGWKLSHSFAARPILWVMKRWTNFIKELMLPNRLYIVKIHIHCKIFDIIHPSHTVVS